MNKFEKIAFSFLFHICFGASSQNIIMNSSFSEVDEKRDTNLMHAILPEKLSNVKSWYLPTYIDYKKLHQQSQFSSLYSFTSYYTSRDRELLIRKKKYTNGDQLFENNMGFIGLNIRYSNPKAIIQQYIGSKLTKGQYCFKFKYKFVKYQSKGNVSLDFCFSETNLSEYYSDKLNVPLNILDIRFRDTLTDGDENSPWLQKCFTIELEGNEKFLTIGTLHNPNTLAWGIFYIDDVELIKQSDTSICYCEIINKDLRSLYKREFNLEELLVSDTMVMFTPKNGFNPGIVSPEAKEYLRNIIAFMQRNTDVKIKFVEFNGIVNPYLKPTNYDQFMRYMKFYGISQDRISAELSLCSDPKDPYCDPKSFYKKIGFKFYR